MKAPALMCKGIDATNSSIDDLRKAGRRDNQGVFLLHTLDSFGSGAARVSRCSESFPTGTSHQTAGGGNANTCAVAYFKPTTHGSFRKLPRREASRTCCIRPPRLYCSINATNPMHAHVPSQALQAELEQLRSQAAEVRKAPPALDFQRSFGGLPNMLPPSSRGSYHFLPDGASRRAEGSHFQRCFASQDSRS